MLNHKIFIIAGLLSSGIAIADVEDTRQFDFDLGAGGSFSIENVNGDMDIRIGNRLSVTAELSASSQKLLDGIKIEVDESSNSVSIDTELPKRIRRGHASVDYIVTLPAGVELDNVSTVNGDVSLVDIEGNVKAETVNGDIDASNLNGDVTFETVNGDIDASFLSMGGNDNINMDTVNGDISADIPNNADVTFEAEVLNGNLSVDDMNVIKQSKNRWGPGKSIEASSGSGSASFDAESVNGSIRVNRS